MLSIVRLRLAIFFSLCFSASVWSLLAPKPNFDNIQHRNMIRMVEPRMVVDTAIPSEVKSLGTAKVNQKALISSIITASYTSIIVSVMALPVCLSAMSADIPFYGATTSSSYLSELISIATVAIVSTVPLLSLFLSLCFRFFQRTYN